MGNILWKIRRNFVRANPPLCGRYSKGIRDINTRARIDAVQCTRCLKVFTYKDGTGGTGTSTLSKHRRKCLMQVPLNDPFRKKDPPLDAKNEYTVSAARYCAFNSLSPESLTGPGCEGLLQSCIDIGVRHGRVDAGALIRHPQTVIKYIEREANEARKSVVDEVRPLIVNHRVAATTDRWTEDYSGDHVLALTLHYINDFWELINRLLFMLPLPPDEPTTAEYIRAALRANVSELGISPCLLQNITFISDGGADVKKALEIYRFVSPICLIVAGCPTCD